MCAPSCAVSSSLVAASACRGACGQRPARPSSRSGRERLGRWPRDARRARPARRSAPACWRHGRRGGGSSCPSLPGSRPAVVAAPCRRRRGGRRPGRRGIRGQARGRARRRPAPIPPGWARSTPTATATGTSPSTPSPSIRSAVSAQGASRSSGSSFPTVADAVRDAHSLYLETASELGVGGLAAPASVPRRRCRGGRPALPPRSARGRRAGRRHWPPGYSMPDSTGTGRCRP